MNEMTIEVNLLLDIAKKILENYIEMWNSDDSFGKAKCNHIDVTLLKDGTNYYAIQITNYGKSTSDILKFSNNIFSTLISMRFPRKNEIVATVYTKNDCNEDEVVYDLCFEKECLCLHQNTSNDKFISVPYWKEYLSFKLKYKLMLQDSENFKQTILNKMNLWQMYNPFTKFTFHQNNKIIYNTHVPLDDDYRSCQIISTALANIIKQSVNMQFRDDCFATLKIDHSHHAEDTLLLRLLPMIHQNYTFLKESNNSIETDQ